MGFSKNKQISSAKRTRRTRRARPKDATASRKPRRVANVIRNDRRAASRIGRYKPNYFLLLAAVYRQIPGHGVPPPRKRSGKLFMIRRISPGKPPGRTLVSPAGAILCGAVRI